MVRQSILRIVSVVLLVTILTQLYGCGKSTPPPPAPPSIRHVVLYKAPGWRGLLVVNGIPVDLMMQFEGIVPITEWTQSGKNDVAIIAQSDLNTKDPLQFQICTATTPDLKDIKPFSDPINIPLPTPEQGPATLGTASFEAPPRDEWPWQRAAMLDKFTEDDQKQINDVFMRFCLAFANRSVDDVLEVISTGSKIKAQAMGITYEQARSNDKAMLEKIFANANNINIIKGSEVQVRPFARGVMIFPMNLDGTAHLVHIDDRNDPNNTYIFDFLSLCKIDGKWVRVN